MRGWARRCVPAAASVLLATSAAALDLDQCARVTNPSHGGEARHVALAGQTVAWIEWWSQEGVFTDLKVADCGAHAVMTARLREENIRDRQFDRRRSGLAALEAFAARPPAFQTFEGLAEAIERGGARDVAVAPMTSEPCACAALHPGLRGTFDAFSLN